MKFRILLATAFAWVASYGQTDIADARSSFSIGQVITVTGVVSNGDELGTVRYIQDESAAIAVYGATVQTVALGDSITVTGELIEFAGLLEVSNISDLVNHGAAVVPNTPLILPLAGMNLANESKLVQVTNCQFTASGTFEGNTNYDITDGNETKTIRVYPGTNLVGENIPTGSVNITGVLGQYNGSFQLIPRSIADMEVYTQPSIVFELYDGQNRMLSGDELIIGTQVTYTLSIQNNGAGGDLEISNVTIDGSHSTDYAYNLSSNTISAGSSADLRIDFTASANGGRFATLELTTNDPLAPVVTLELYGVGPDELDSEPVSSVSNLNLLPTSYALNGSFDTAPDAEFYLVLWSKEGTPDTDPVDGITYQRGDILGNSTVAYVGAANSFKPRGVVAGSTYNLKVFPFNGRESFENYNVTSVLTGSTTTPEDMIGNYYSGINSANIQTFVTELHDLINNHTHVNYGQYKYTIIEEFTARDTVDGQSVVTCVYTGTDVVYSGVFDYSTLNLSREHTYPHSWMPSYPANSSYPYDVEYNDQHNLFPALLSSANQVRSNLPLGIVTDEYSRTGEGKYGKDVNGYFVYEPRDEHKGDAARAIMYMAVCYNGLQGNWGLDGHQDQEILKDWHYNDLPDNYEMARNDYIFNETQFNRNPFIDSVHWVDLIDFETVIYQGTASLSQKEVNVNVYPNPVTTEQFTIECDNFASAALTNMNGNLLLTSDVNTIKINHLPSGLYLCKILTLSGEVIITKIIKE